MSELLRTPITTIVSERFTFSMEFFPPKNNKHLETFEEHIGQLEQIPIDFCSVTYGAGGTTKQLTPRYVDELSKRFKVPAISHLTCIDHSYQSLEDELTLFDSIEVHNVLALRGDPKEDSALEIHHELNFAIDLLRALRERKQYCIGVAAHVEGHIDSVGDDFHFQAEKIGMADFAITQLFYDVKSYEKFIDRLRSKNISVPVIPGMLPLTNAKRIEKVRELSGASIPEELINELARFEDGSDDQRLVGEEFMVELCEKLKDVGAPGLHFYTMNRANSVNAIISKLRSAP